MIELRARRAPSPERGSALACFVRIALLGLLVGGAAGALRVRLARAPVPEAPLLSPALAAPAPAAPALQEPSEHPPFTEPEALELHGAAAPSAAPEESGLAFITMTEEDTLASRPAPARESLRPAARPGLEAASGARWTGSAAAAAPLLASGGGGSLPAPAPSRTYRVEAASKRAARAARSYRAGRDSGFLSSSAGAAGPRPSVAWPSLSEMKAAMAADAAAYAASQAPLIGPDPASSFAIVTSLTAAPGKGGFGYTGSSGSGGGAGGGAGGGGGGAPGAAPSVPAQPKPASQPKPAQDDKPQSSHGIPWRAGANDTGLLFPDISVWRKPSSWDALNRASSGIIVMKVRQVRIDPTFNGGLDEAEKRKMIVIGYAFGYGADGAMQADALLQNFPPKPGRILMLDLEHNPYGSTMTESQAISFVERIKARTGKYPFLYTSASRARPGALAKCPRYVAQWGSRPAISDVWQFTNGVVGPQPHSFPGVGSCDINRLTMAYGELRAMANLDSRKTLQLASADSER